MTELKRKPVLKKRPSGKFVQHQFQIEDISTLAELDASANWSEMGAMKTTTAEWLWQTKLKHIPNPRVLVITTKSGKGTYFESLSEVLPDWDVFSVGTRGARLVLGSNVVPFDVKLPTPLHFRPVVVIAHYHCFTNRACHPRPVKNKETGFNILQEDGTFLMEFPFCSGLLTREWDFIVCDEAHRLKNPDSQWTRNIKKLRTTFKHLMTGTGFINNPSEIWSLLNWLYPKTYNGEQKFFDRYCDWEDYSGWKKVTGILKENETEFKELVRRIGVRRTMLECFPDIKEPIETEMEVELNDIQRKMYDEIKTELYTLDQQGVPLHSANVLSMLNRLRQIAVATPEVTEDYYDEITEKRIIRVKLREPSSKLDAAMDIIEGLEWDDERHDQVVVFSALRDPLELLKPRLAEQFDKNGRPTRRAIPYLHLHAGMNEKDRYEMWHDVWPQKQHQVFLCTLAVGSESINLTAANRAIFLDQSWSPAQNKQAIGRIYRPGQKEACQLIYIRAANTVDARILATNMEKQGWFNQIFGDGKTEGDDDE